VLPPFEGNYKVLISRPIYAVYEAETRTKWISALGELFTHYKISAFPRTHVFTMEQVSGVLPNSRDYSRRFNRQHYIDAARKLGATHLVYQEYQPDRSGRRTRYVMELYWIQEAATVERISVNIQHNDFEAGLQSAISRLAELMDPGAKNTPAFSNVVWGKDAKALETFGNLLADEGKFSRDNALSTFTSAERLIQRNAALIGYQYAGALLAGRAESYAKAIHHLDAVIAKSREHSALQLRRAEYLRGAQRYSEAMTAAETASRNPALRIPASIEMAMIHQAQGNLDRARSEYSAIVQSGEADGRVLFMLALLSIQSGRITESEDYLRQAEARGLALDEAEYIELGKAYGAAGSGHEDRAIEFLRRGMGVRQNNEEAWEEIAAIHRRMGNEHLAADAYVNLFKINMQAHSMKLKTAGEIYERLGMVDRAKDAYSLFLDRRFSNKDVSMSLARIYFNEKDCKRLPNVLRGLDTIPEAAQMLGECGFRVRTIDASQTLRARKLSPFMLTMRISGAVVAAGGLTGGLILNYGVIDPVKKKYDDYPSDLTNLPSTPTDGMDPDKVDDMHKQLKDAMFWRNTLYVLAGVGFSGFAVTFFF
jgi:tetratricopeptide (TPR) repeat protein